MVPLISAPLILLVALFGDMARKWFAVAVGGITALLGLYQALTFTGSATQSLYVWVPLLHLGLQVKIDGLSVLLAAFISFVSFFIVLYSVGYMEGERGQTRYYSLILLFIGSMLGLVMAGNLLQLYFLWELVGICSAFLIAFHNDRESARRAGYKAFFVTRVGDAALLLAVLLIIARLGTSDIDSILSAVNAGAIPGDVLFLIGILLLIGAMGKSAQVPLHVWLPDAMEGPTPVSALIHAATMVNAGVYLAIRMSPLFQASALLPEIVLIVGLASVLLGAACASVAEDLKKILAYSTISQLGLMFGAIGLGTALGATYHLVSQGLFKALGFLAAGSVIHALGTRNVEEMGGLRKSMKYTYVGFLFSVLAMSGLPPLIGFWSKDLIISSAFQTNTLAAILILVSSAITALYSFRALFKAFHGASKTARPIRESPLVMTVPIFGLAIAVTVAWIIMNGVMLVPLGSNIIEILPLSASLIVLLVGAALAYFAFLSRGLAAQALLLRSSALGLVRSALLDGLGFDRLYGFLWARLLQPAIRLFSRMQSGLLGMNTALMLLTLALLIFLLSTGVI